MDRNWISGKRDSEGFKEGVEEFIKWAVAHKKSEEKKFYCPCRICGNKRKVCTVDQLREHIWCNGMTKSYTEWIWHGERATSGSTSTTNHVPIEETEYDLEYEDQNEVNTFDDDRINEMLRDVNGNLSFKSDAEKPLYTGCTKFTRLSGIMKLFNLKAANGWSDKGFTALLEVLTEMLPEGNLLPSSTYEAKKIMCPLGLNVDKIHACPNDCLLYRKEYKDLEKCPRCGVSRYKVYDDDCGKKGSPAKVLWYLPIVPRFKRLFASAKDSKNLVWHEEERNKDGMLRHPADSPQWMKIDSVFPEFGGDARNLRLGLCTDGVNPFGSLSSQYSVWPVLLVIYNLPPWLCMKRKYMMLSLLISGPKQPGNDIDVYLEPLIEDLKKLWDEGVPVYDAYSDESFTLKAMVFCTINDFPAYGNLSGYSVKGCKACPICENDTDSVSLSRVEGSGKQVYLGHRRFLPRNHPYRRLRKSFNGDPDHRSAPRVLTGKQVHERVSGINTVFGKPYKPSKEKNPWKKKSIFWSLSYWEHLHVRHCIDLMHVEKNVCDSLIGTLLNIPGKTKDGVKSRYDLVSMGIRPELAPQNKGKRTYLPPACYTLSKKEKTILCECLNGIKVPHGYSSNVRSIVSMKDLKLIGMKSHDCHVLIQQFLPVAIRSILPKNVRYAIIKLCMFFKKICSKVLDPGVLDAMQDDIVVTLCQFEIYFPPSFFDIMVHLVVHLVREAKLCGPVFLRYMYPPERNMGVLKRHVRNPYRPEGSMVEGYLNVEVIEFCTEYLSRLTSIGIPKSRHEGRIEGKGTLGRKVLEVGRELQNQAHLYVLQQSTAVNSYIVQHLAFLKHWNPCKSERWLRNEHNNSFIKWFKDQVNVQLKNKSNEVSDDIRWLAHGPSINVISYEGYDINGYCFYTKCRDDKSTMQNSGVSLVASALHFASAKDNRPQKARMSYYGVIEDIWELDYTEFKVPVFRCKWVDINRGVRVDDLGFTLVDFSKLGHHDEPFIMASQPKQIFYITDPMDARWSVVLPGKRQFVTSVGIEVDEDEYDDIDDSSDFPNAAHSLPQNEDELSGYYLRNDHDEGVWVEDESLPKSKKARKD